MKPYYYANSQRVFLDVDPDHVVVDLDDTARSFGKVGSAFRSLEADLASFLLKTFSQRTALAPHKYLVSKAELAQLAKRLSSSEAHGGQSSLSEAELGHVLGRLVNLHLPVFRCDLVQLVALPEVRVDYVDDLQQQRLEQWLSANPKATKRLTERPGRYLTLSATAHNSIELARQLVEEAGQSAVSPRFLRVVRKQ